MPCVWCGGNCMSPGVKLVTRTLNEFESTCHSIHGVIARPTPRTRQVMWLATWCVSRARFRGNNFTSESTALRLRGPNVVAAQCSLSNCCVVLESHSTPLSNSAEKAGGTSKYFCCCEYTACGQIVGGAYAVQCEQLVIMHANKTH